MTSCLPLESKRLPIALRVIALISFPCPFLSPPLFTPYAIRLACDSPRLPTLAFFMFAVRYPPSSSNLLVPWLKLHPSIHPHAHFIY